MLLTLVPGVRMGGGGSVVASTPTLLPLIGAGS